MNNSSRVALALLGGLLAAACGDKKSESKPPSEANEANTGDTLASPPTTSNSMATQDVKDELAIPSMDASAAATVTDAGGQAATADNGEEQGVGEEADEEIPFESDYVGVHKLGVNRVNEGNRTGPGRIFREANALVLTASVENGAYSLSVNGIVKPRSPTEFVLEGTLKGVPNLEWRNEPPRERTTEGRFTFRSTKGRKYWRLYEVDGKECVCNDNCGNEFCYIDLAF